MANRPITDHSSYTIAAREVVAATAELRVLTMTLAPGEVIPWHYHSQVTDTFFCLEGTLGLETPAPGQVVLLGPGESLAIPPRQPHRVDNRGTGHCRFLLVQGIGSYDFVPVRS